MVARTRRGRSRRGPRGTFALFWILLAGFSGFYLYTLFTDPSALGVQAARLNVLTGPLAPAAPAGGAQQASSSPADSAGELATIKSSLDALSQQLAEMQSRLKPIEKVVGPVATLPPATSVTTSPPGAAPLDAPSPEEGQTEAEPEEAAATPEPAPQATAAPEPPAPVTVDEPQMDEAAIAEQPAPESTAAPEEQAGAPEPQPVAAAPIEEETETAAESGDPAAAAATTPAPTVEEALQSAALDPVALPATANDGTTRYGIEIGSVPKQEALRPLWREFLTNHAALVAGLQPRRVLAPDKKWRLIAGPFADAQEAEAACALFKKADRTCEATVYAGDSL